MSASLVFDKLETLKPSLPANVFMQPRQYGGETWYVLHDKVSGRFHRFNALANSLIGLMTGHHELREIFTIYNDQFEAEDERRVEKDELVELVQYLYVADLLLCDFPASTQEIFARQNQTKNQFWKRLVQNPVTWKFRLFNPDRYLSRFTSMFQLIATKTTLIIWCLVVCLALLQTAVYWDEVSANKMTDILSPKNIFLIWLIYPVLKIIHELGHAILTKAWGGQIYECGVVFVLGTPLPYVDATSATGFSHKSKRLFVSAAGVMIELFMAAVSLLIWLQLEAGLLKNILFNVVLIGSISTLFFNGNPLMRFDGYHLLYDLIDQPNLAGRAQAQLKYLIKRYLFKLDMPWSVAHSRNEAWGLTTYGVLAFLYRIFILISIVMIAIYHFPQLGLALGAWLLIFQLIVPLGKYAIYVVFGKEVSGHRWRAGLASSGVILLLVFIVFILPVPHRTRTEAVLWLPDSARVRAQASGHVIKLWAEEGQTVQAGDKLLTLKNPQLNSELALAKERLKEFNRRIDQAWAQDYSQVQLLEQERKSVAEEIELLRTKIDNLIVRSPSSGQFNVISADPIEGRFFKEGDTVAMLIQEQPPRLRAAVLQHEINLVRNATQRISVKLSGNISKTYQGHVIEQVPESTNILPSAALGTANGGKIVLDGSDQSLTRSAEPIFIMDIDVVAEEPLNYYGQRAWVIFHFQSRSIAKRIYDELWQQYISIQTKA